MAKNITKLKHRFPMRQIRRIPRFFRHHWPVMALCAIALSVAYLNYDPGTYLSGWDNLHPEFDIRLNLKRAIFSVWQEHRGTGLLSGQAPAADLPRIILLALLQAINIPSESLRYLTTFLPLVLGPLGVYCLFFHHLFREKLDSATTQFASFFGGLFYLLNLNTLQTFFVPFETFTWFYGSLPFLLYFTLSYLKRPSLNKFSTLFIVSLLSTPSFYVETVFLILFVILIPFFIEFFWKNKQSVHSLKSIFFSLISLSVPHLFWLLPVIFFVSTQGHVVVNAKINNISSVETYYRNLEFATIKDLALIKGYLFNYLDMSADLKYDYLLTAWRNHLSNSIINLIGFLIFTTAITGLYYSIKKDFAWTKAFIGTLATCLFFLLGGGLLINSSIPLVGELFRSPFTKFALPFSLCYSFFFAIGTMFILDLFTFLHSRLTYIFTLFSITAALFLFSSPAFSGNLVSSKLRVEIPTEYFDLFSYLKTQDSSARIANFPQSDFWGWLYYDWGYRGSGFLWQGIKQPLMDRAFDVWEKTNESYYEEISTAVYSDNQKDFEAVLDKYAISWILLDKHVISASSQTDMGTATLTKFLTNSSKFSEANNFNDQIYLYKVSLNSETKNFLTLSDNRDLTSENYYPFTSLSLRPNNQWVEKGNFLSASLPISSLSSENQNLTSKISIPSLTNTESLLPVRVEYQKTGNTLRLRLSPLTPIIIANSLQIDLDQNPLEVTIPIRQDKNNFILQLDKSYSQIIIPAEVPDLSDFEFITTTYLPSNKPFTLNLYDSLPETSLELLDALSQAGTAQCYTQKPNRKIEKITTTNSLSLLGTDVVGCISTPLPRIPKNTLISLNFTYSSPTQTLANANISAQNLASEIISQPLESEKELRRAQIFTSSTGDYQQANFILEASDTKSVQEIQYQDISLSTHPLLFFSSQKLTPISGKEIEVTSLSNLQISLPLTQTSYDITNTSRSNSLLPENLNCDQFNNGKTVKIVSEDKIIYQSQNAIECDYQNLRHLPHSLNYLISVEARNEKGLPLSFCLENFSTRRCDVYDRLSDSQLPQYLVNPIANPNEPAGYTLHLFNQSIGNRITSNALKSLSIHPIPLNFMKSISHSLSNKNNVIPGQDPESSTPSKILASTHPAEYIYTVSIDPSLRGGETDVAIQKNSNPPTLSLFQTQSPHWQALQVSEADLQLPTWLLTTKIFFTYPHLTKLPHNDFGLWYNSWDLSSLRVSYSNRGNLTPQDSKSSLVIIYLPQYLEFIGLSFIPLTLLILLIKNHFSRSKKSPLK